MTADLEHRFEYHPPRDGERVAAHEAVRAICGAAAASLDEVLPEGREKALAFTNLEQAMMWGNAAIARAPYDDGSDR